MRKTLFILLAAAASVLSPLAASAEGRWITSYQASGKKANTWIAYRKDITLKGKPSKETVRIAADSKYWLWVNGRMVVFEGQLKRGPSPTSTYYDELDLAPYLRSGQNKIAVLMWYFGKEGFSHKNSGLPGLIISSESGRLDTDRTWLCRLHPAYGTASGEEPNYRLPESNILFDANRDMAGWQTADCGRTFGFASAQDIGGWGGQPWGDLVRRPTPQWKDFGVKATRFERVSGQERDTIKAHLPYNMQMTPVFTLTDSQGGSLIGISTDHSYAGGTANVRAEYVTRRGEQTYESLGWMNGEWLYLVVPKHVAVKSLAYRETGYDTYAAGTFSCDDDFFSRFWQKGLRTLYVNMRDTYFDCPERERAQWFGDLVVLMGESFYTYSTSVHALMRKGIHELCAWQHADSTLSAPIPAGNYDTELPAQMLASVGLYGFWNYYMNTGDRQTIADVYPAVRRYLGVWHLDDTGLTAFRPGGWTWGDWGDNRDIRLIFAGWHYMALDAAARMADLLGRADEARGYRATMERVKEGYNKCWNGTAYRHPDYKELTDDRVQALAVISGIAPRERYGAILRTLKESWHSSPYMEKYVMESLFQMGYSDYAMERTHKRFAEMVDDDRFTTLFEGWGIGPNGFGGGTTNHAWSGGTLTVLSQYMFGLSPEEPAWKVFAVAPDPATMHRASITVPTVAGTVGESFSVEGGRMTVTLTVPKGTTAHFYVPQKSAANALCDGRHPQVRQAPEGNRHYGRSVFDVQPGKHTIAYDL